LEDLGVGWLAASPQLYPVNLKFVQRNFFLFEVLCYRPWTLPPGVATPLVPSPLAVTKCVQTEVKSLWEKGGEQTEYQLASQWIE